ncbi:MAG: tetratricopeptide repeat protein [Acidobacteria bacterium]|nr:tetratricopeptide repeat protein [Acidobacteriota bacterium]
MRATLLLTVLLSAAVQGKGDPPAPAAEAHRQNAIRHSWRAERLHDAFRHTEAAQAYARAVDALTAAFGEAHPRTLVALNNHASALLELNRAAEAETVLRDALDRRQRAALGEDDCLAATWNNLGEALLATGRVAAAISLHARALALRQRLLPAAHPEVVASLTHLGEALRQNGELTRARGLLEQAVPLWAAPATVQTGAAAMPLMPGYARALNSLALLHDAEGRRREAERALLNALASSARAYGPKHEFTATLHFNLAGHYSRRQDWKRAEAHCRKALNVFELQPSHQDSKFGLALSLHAQVLDQISGRKREAQAQRKRAAAILSLR